jgi:DnaK suppressor protein
MTERIQWNSAVDSQEQESKKDPREIFIQNLTWKKEEVEKVIKELKEQHKGYREHLTDGNLSEEADRADNEISTQQYYIFLERKYSELKNIDRLINKVSKDKDFGWCEECGDSISLKRLSVIPDATMCIHCQREYEKMESRRGNTTSEYKNPIIDNDLEDENIRDIRELKAFIGDIDIDLTSVGDLGDIDLTEDLPK